MRVQILWSISDQLWTLYFRLNAHYEIQILNVLCNVQFVGIQFNGKKDTRLHRHEQFLPRMVKTNTV